MIGKLVTSMAMATAVLLPAPAAAQSPTAAVPTTAVVAHQPKLNLKQMMRSEAIRLAGSEDRSELKTSAGQSLFSRPCYSPAKRALAGAIIGAVAGGAFAIYVNQHTIGSGSAVVMFTALGAGVGALIGFGSC